MPVTSAQLNEASDVLGEGVDLSTLGSGADEAAKLMRALSHPDRLYLLCALSQGGMNVTELGEATGMTQPSLSQQLGVLKQQGLVDATRQGKHMHYRVVSEDALAVLATLYARFCTQPSSSTTPTLAEENL